MAEVTAITDRLGRRIDYARISLTDRCNYRCTYCMPESGVELIPHDQVMRYEEILYLCGVLRELGVTKVRFTGGEPLVRRGAVSFLAEFKKKFAKTALSLTTNGSLLAGSAARLAAIGLASMNISLDTLDPDKFRSITRVGEIEDVACGIAAVRQAGIPNIKTNTVLIRGFNDSELPSILSFAWENGATPRLIEFMPLGDDVWRRDKFIGAEEIMALLRTYGEWHPLITPQVPAGVSRPVPMGPAKYYQNADGRVVGVIEAVSNHFCEMCNRLRITAAGNMRACLFVSGETPLGGFLQRRDTAGLKRAILDGIDAKPDYWRQSRDGTAKMSSIGG